MHVSIYVISELVATMSMIMAHMNSAATRAIFLGFDTANLYKNKHCSVQPPTHAWCTYVYLHTRIFKQQYFEHILAFYVYVKTTNLNRLEFGV